jgi:hypothetical protein
MFDQIFALSFFLLSLLRLGVPIHLSISIYNCILLTLFYPLKNYYYYNHRQPKQAPIIWRHFYHDAVVNDGTVRVGLVPCGVWDMDYRPQFWVSWPLD